MTRPVYEDEEDLKRERELTLGTGVILGIFLALVVLCGAFFGFGYKMGSRQPVPLGAAASTDGAQPSSGMFSGFKPAAGSPMGSSAGSGSAAGGGEVGVRERLAERSVCGSECAASGCTCCACGNPGGDDARAARSDRKLRGAGGGGFA